jgi:hypothetical protein
MDFLMAGSGALFLRTHTTGESQRRVFRNSEEVYLGEGVLSKKWRIVFLKDRGGFFG